MRRGRPAPTAMMSRCKISYPSLIVLVLLQGMTLLMFYGWYVQVKPQSPPPTQSKVHVLLLSSWRSGSSFMGQVFSQHPSVFYLMEPAWHVWSSAPRVGMRFLRMAVRDLIHRVFQCDFSVMDSYMPEQRNMSKIFMWSHSRALCSPPACSLTPRGQFSNQSQCYKSCDSDGLQKVEDACNTYSHVVLKEVRFFELESLYPLLKDPTLDFRIVHLVRDPRAVVRSKEQSAGSFVRDNAMVLEQKNIPASEVQYQAIQEICRSHVRINERAMLKPPPFLKGRYKMVRFEDIAFNPLKEINDIYDFVGLQMTPELQDWIITVTQGKGKGSTKDAFDITSRNAKAVTQAWRKALPFSKVKKVQDACKGAMSLLGYRTVDNEKEQKNMDVDLLVPKVPFKFNWEVHTKKVAES